MYNAALQAPGGYIHKFIHVMGYTAPGSTQGKGWTYNDGEVRLQGKPGRLLKAVGDGAFGDPFPNLLHGPLKELPVLGFFDGFQAGAQKPDIKLIQDSAVGQF